MSKIIKNTSIYTIGNILPQAVGFLLLPVYTRYLTPSDYGIVASMAVLNTILAVFLTLCMERSIFRLYFDYKSHHEQRDFLGTVFISLVINSVVITSLMFIFRELVSKIYTTIDFYPFYVYAILTSFFTVFYYLPAIYFQITERPKDFIALSLGKFFLTAFLTLWYVVKLEAGAAGQLEAGLIANIILFPLFLYFTVKIVNFKFNFNILRKTLIYCMPFIPSLLTAWALNMSGRIFIERYSNLHDVGIYSLGYTIAMAGLVIMSGFDMAYFPYFFKLANADEGKIGRKKLERVNNIYALVLLLIVFIIALFSREIVIFFMDKKYIQTYSITRILIFSYYFSGLTGIITLSILQEKKSKQNMYISIIVALFNTILNFLLISRFGMYGAAYAIFISYLVGIFVQYQYSKRCFFIPFHFKRIFVLFTLSVLIIVAYQFVIEKYLLISLISKFIFVVTVGWIIILKVKHAGVLNLS